MTSYPYEKTPVCIDRLLEEIAAAGLENCAGADFEYPNVLTIFFGEDLSPEDKAALDGIVEAHSGDPIPNPEWMNFCNALGASEIGQRIIGTDPPHACYAAFIAAAAGQNGIMCSQLMPMCAEAYEITAEEKASVNALIDQYHVPITKFTV